MEELLDLRLKAHGLLSHLGLPVDCVRMDTVYMGTAGQAWPP
ncbi:hypothetical protein BSIN_2892 [Burkholderia singularis]|uniref:Uncharacterized protein n=1 Tax=Burkholderia singularis TaxID=1503053 RepID=A0A238H3A0_9BURK|nr:hypothetical protein BSIN_2892 [Burkholderia singularis]